MIKVSVIVPVYKVPLEYLRKCLGSLATQTLQECEFIIISDGAPEAERSICKEHAALDKRFKFFEREHAGVSATRNYGITQAQGEYITFVDADDWIESRTCDMAYSFAKKNNSDIVIWDFVLFYENGQLLRTSFLNTQQNSLSENELFFLKERIIYPLEKKYTNIPSSVCKIIKRNILEKNNILFDKNVYRFEDRLFWFQAIDAARTISYLKEALYHYRQHSISTVSSFHKNDFQDLLPVLQQLNQLSNCKMRLAVANETIATYYGCMAKIKNSKLNISQQYKELDNLRKQIKKDSFHTLIQPAYLPSYSAFAKAEIFFLKRRIAILFPLRQLKWALSRFFSK